MDTVTVTEKQCSRCKEFKSLDNFYRDVSKRNGLGFYPLCKECKRSYQRVYESINPSIRTPEQARIRYEKNKVSMNMSNAIRRSLKGITKTCSWFELVDYSLDELKEHLSSQFAEGMNWENYGQWHIDHIRPISSFNITSTSCEDFKKCWALENLQPLWARDNLTKGSRWIK